MGVYLTDYSKNFVYIGPVCEYIKVNGCAKILDNFFEESLYFILHISNF